MKKLAETTKQFPQTEIWNDSCSCAELEYCIANGGVGATTNPVIVLNVLKNEMSDWQSTIQTIIGSMPEATEDDIAWELIKKMGAKAGELLLPIFNETKGKKGRISFQTNAKYYRSKELLVRHGIDLASTIVNSQVKIPASAAGIKAFEELTYLGISINATVSFTVAQALAVGEAVERGLNRRIAEGKSIEEMNPVCTIMAGRLDDHLKKCVHPEFETEILEWAGVAVVKRAYDLYQKRGYRTKLLVAAFRNSYQWHELIGANIVLTIPYKWQVQFNESDYTVEKTIDKEVNADYLTKLLSLPEFVKAYNEDGLKIADFEYYGAFIATIKGFLQGYDELVTIIRSFILESKNG
jgi:transaldolase